MSGSTSSHEYAFNGQHYEAFIARPNRDTAPVVLVCHAWGGQSDFDHAAAKRLAEMGYVGVAIDVYGVGKRGTTIEENQALMTPLVEDRGELQARLNAGLEFARGLDGVDASRAGAIGFCFGGLCVLDLARMGADVKGVVSFHGILGAPDNLSAPRISSSVLALHGWSDPMAPPDDVTAFSKEMDAAGADWQLLAFGATKHAFTNPDADNDDLGLKFHPKNRDRAWALCEAFLNEALA